MRVPITMLNKEKVFITVFLEFSKEKEMWRNAAGKNR
jgi:hypothetical protein